MLTRRDLLALLPAAITTSAHAQAPAWPARPVTIVAPAPPGGLTDLLARSVAQQLQLATGQSFVVENRSGMSGVVASQQVAKSPADGYLLMMTNAGTHAIVPAMVSGVGFDTVRDFTHLAMLGGSSWLFVVSTDSPHRTWADWLQWAQAQPNGFTLGTPGDGSHGHLIGALLAAARPVRFNHVAYKGAAQALADLVGGHLQAVLVTASSALPLAQARRIRPLLATSPRRLPDFAHVPTATEAGLPSLTGSTWFGLAAPAGLDALVRKAIQSHVAKAMATSEWRDRLAAAGIESVDIAPEQVEGFVASEVQRWGPVARGIAAARPATQRP
ncbi:MAG: tripartite tricarboxylate transporter substrate binding protein [Burkholderiales bacterium]|nr:tripartite tricarboxylate transporter substrate binding protein [Burkholderiales bacterium]